MFKSRRVLLHDYTPRRLPHRECQLNALKRYFDPVLREGVTAKVHVYGRIGTGKTVLCKRFGRDLEAEASKAGKKLKYVHINLAYTPKPYHVMNQFLHQMSQDPLHVKAPKGGLSPEENLSIVAKAISKKDYLLVLTLDEVDTYIKERRDPKILYMFSRIYELYPDPVPRVSLIYVSRSLDWMNKLDKATLDTIGRVSGVQLQQYGLPKLRDIISYRTEEAFQPGAISEDVMAFIADIAMDYGGIRYGLELLMEAGGQAELDLARSVRAEHVRRGHVNIPKGVNGACYPTELSLHKQLLLKGVVETLQGTGDPYASVEEVYEGYQVVCERYEREAEAETEIRSYLKDLSVEGYILLKMGEEGGVVGAEFPVDRMAEAIERALKHTLQAS